MAVGAPAVEEHEGDDDQGKAQISKELDVSVGSQIVELHFVLELPFSRMMNP